MRELQTEAQFQRTVTDYATMTGWLWYHANYSRRDHAGFPDICLLRDDRLIFAELKSAKGKVRPEQRFWLEMLRKTCAETYLWRPSDWDEIEEVLR